jgi:3,4-dihydroxy-2-butanone 4-phosphate synthase
MKMKIENEGDFWQQPKSNSEMINFMATHGRGLICAHVN